MKRLASVCLIIMAVSGCASPGRDMPPPAKPNQEVVRPAIVILGDRSAAEHPMKELANPLEFQVRPGSLKDNIREMLTLYGVNQVVFEKNIECIDWSSRTQYKLQSKTVAGLLDQMIDGLPVAANFHRMDMSVTLKGVGAGARKCAEETTNAG